MIERRSLGRSGVEVSALGFGCWPIGGPWSTPGGSPLGWSEVDDDEMIALVERYGIASINRTPLAMGLLTGRDTRRVGADIRAAPPQWWRFFKDGNPVPEWFARVQAIRETLTAGGRTLAQGALGWIWARSTRTIPIPGFRTVKQAEENAGALEHGPLSAEQMAEIDRLLS